MKKAEKTKRLYRFLEADYVLSSIRDQKLKISLFDQLNDPHELVGARIEFPDLVRNLLDDYDGAVLDSLTPNLIDQNKRKMGILCWCRRYSKAVMWAHYAERHRGAALGFDVFAGPKSLGEVKYFSKPQRIMVDDRLARELCRWLNQEVKPTMQLGKRLASYLDHVFLIKNEDWVHEDEWRSFTTVTDQENGLFFKSFKSGLHLREVILGLRCDITPEDVRDAVAGLPGKVKILRAKVVEGSFEMVAVDAFEKKESRLVQANRLL